MLLLGISTVILAALGTLFLGLLSMLRNPKSATSKLFFIFTFFLSGYIVSNYAVSQQTTDINAFMWIRIVMTTALGINILFFLLVDTFPQPQLKTKPRVVWLTVLFTIALLPVTTTSLIFQSIHVRSGNIDSTPGLGMPLFLLHTIIFLGGGFIQLVRRYRHALGIEKAQIRLFLAGTIFMFLSLLITNLLFVIVFNSSAFIGLLPLYTLVFVGCISYAMFRHKFLDIGSLVARTVSYTLIISFIAVAFSLLISLTGRFLLSIYFTRQEQIALIGITVIITFFYHTVRQMIERTTDKIFFRGRYNSTEVLNQASHIMASTLRLEDLAHRLLQVIIQELRISKGAFILLTDGLIADVKSEGFSPAPTFSDDDIKIISAISTTINIDDLEEGQAKTILRNLDISIVVHLRTEGNQIGLLMLGAKSSGDIYSEHDVSLLEILAPEAAIAIQNAFAYEDIRRFNITLQEEVNRATENLRSANERLKSLDKLKDEFVSLASHELRTPLTAIRSYIWMTTNGKGGDLTPKQHYYLDRAFNSTDRLIKLVNDMLNISRIESGRLSMQFTKTNVATLISDVISEVQPRITELGLHLSTTVPPGISDIIADTDKIKEVLINLVGNSMKFTQRDGHIFINVTSSPTEAILSVHDTGIGIEKENIGKLFTKFSALPTSGTSSANAQSTGLGLYISKSIVTLHGGTIEASSEGLGKGSVFTFSLPLYSEEKLKELQATSAPDGLGIIHSTLP